MKNTVQKNQMNEKLEKSKTGIFGFDDITFGGLPKSRPTLIVGGIGSGKTFMSMLFILNGISDFKENGVFMTFEERSDELITNFSNLKYDITDYLEKKNLYFEHLHIGQYELHESGKYNIEGLFVRIEQAIKLTNAKRIVLDSLDTLFSNLDISLLRSEFKRLFSWLKEKNITAIITAEKETMRIQKVENDFKKYSFYLMLFTAIVALGTVISAWFFSIEIWKLYVH